MSDLVEYSDTQKKYEKALQSISQTLTNINSTLDSFRIRLEEVSASQTSVKNDMEKVKSGLQKELFQSLQQLHERLYINKKWATPAEKAEAKLYYDEIHNMGQDGWSDKYFNEIIGLPESERDLYK